MRGVKAQAGAAASIRSVLRQRPHPHVGGACVDRIAGVRGVQLSSVAFDGKADKFGRPNQAELYALYRPRYSKEIVDYVVGLVKNKKCCIDVACGSGQLTNLLEPHFLDVTGIDKSFEQLSKSNKENTKVKYVAGSAFDIPVANKSVDLITVAQAFHWIVPHDKLYSEVDRVLRSKGVFSILGYAIPYCTHEGVQKEFRDYYVNTLGSLKRPGEPGCLWDIYRPEVDNGFADTKFPWSMDRKEFPDVVMMPIKNFIGFLQSQSAYKNLIQQGKPDPLPHLQERIMKAFDTNDESSLLTVVVPYYVLSHLTN
jgi:ubiquinone/menaquinone biosynthesis C-methylase UbiE